MYASFLRSVVFYAKSSQKLNLNVRNYTSAPNLSPYDVNSILRENEFKQMFSDDGPVKGYDSNQLASNSPIEDSHTEATLIHENESFICGIFDGHGGPSCSQVISKRLLRYIAASIVDKNMLEEIMEKGGDSQSFLKCHNDKVDFVKEIKGLYEKSFQTYVESLLKKDRTEDISKIIETTFVQLDDDLSKEALETPNIRTISVAMSGAVACVALIKKTDLHVASTGDCMAVMGALTETGQWQTKVLTHEHNTDNISEVKRILDEHPQNEQGTIFRNERLLGQLAPLRALGDFRYKWSNKIMQDIVVPQFGEHSVPMHYYTPPYLTARPEMTNVKLTPNDRFLVIASDGLWDFLSPKEVVELVGEHMLGKAFLEPLTLSKVDITLGEISETLKKRKAGRKTKLLDQNSATHLIRNALGSTEYGVEHSKLSYILSIPKDVVRQYRDDITITIVYFNTDYIEKNS